MGEGKGARGDVNEDARGARGDVRIFELSLQRRFISSTVRSKSCVARP